MNGSEQLNSELTTTLEHLIDKFNLTLEVSSEQIKDFSIQMAEKIITWEIVTSLVAIAGWVLVILALIRLHEHFKIGSFKQLDGEYKKLWETTADNRKEIDKAIAKYSFKIVIVFLIILFGGLIVVEIKDLLLCAIFPEKVILEFISLYL